MIKISRLWNLLSYEHYQLRNKIYTLELKNETLEETLKDELFKEFMNKLGEPIEINRLKEENKRLRKRIKFYKEELKDESKKYVASRKNKR